jgi:uncharacterized protein YllA (UPF0747 family)
MLLVQKFSAISHRKTSKKADKLNLSGQICFQQMDLVNKQTAQLSDFFRYVSAKEQLKKQFEALPLTNKQMLHLGAAQEIKQIKGLENLEKTLITSAKRKTNDVLERVTDLQNELFPNKSLQERQNFQILFRKWRKLIPR